jgi:hypothetical protein
MKKKTRIVVSVVIIFVLSGALFFLFQKSSIYTREYLEACISTYMPLTSKSFERLFEDAQLRFSEYGDELNHCAIIKDAHPVEKPHDLHIHLVATLGVRDTNIDVKIEIFYDMKTGNPCYKAHVYDMKSWLICFKDQNLPKMMMDVSNLCGRYVPHPLYDFWM